MMMSGSDDNDDGDDDRLRLQHEFPREDPPEEEEPPQQTHRRTPQQKKKKPETKKKKRHGARNQNRHKIFVKWLLDTFDLDESEAPPIPPIHPPGDTRGIRTGSGGGENDGEVASLAERAEGLRLGTTAAGRGDDGSASTISTSSPRRPDTATTTPPPPPAAGRSMHVLDVAGGKGEVAARLTMCHKQRVVMVDPRPADVAGCYETLVLPKIPNKWQRRLEERRKSRPTFVRDVLASRFRQLVTTFDGHKVLSPSSSSMPPFLRKKKKKQGSNDDANDDDDADTTGTGDDDDDDEQQLREAVRDATLIVGLHADGATEAIVDAALEHGKPFVVVPCCVFPNFFPFRRIPVHAAGGGGGETETGSTTAYKPVRTHEDFCAYLLRKDPRLVREILPFEGRNVAIWWDGK